MAVILRRDLWIQSTLLVGGIVSLGMALGSSSAWWVHAACCVNTEYAYTCADEDFIFFHNSISPFSLAAIIWTSDCVAYSWCSVCCLGATLFCFTGCVRGYLPGYGLWCTECLERTTGQCMWLVSYYTSPHNHDRSLHRLLAMAWNTVVYNLIHCMHEWLMLEYYSDHIFQEWVQMDAQSVGGKVM